MLAKRKLGRQGLEVSALGLGCLGMSQSYGAADEAESLATLDLLAVLTLPSQYDDENLHTLNLSKAVNLCLERGNSAAAPVSYASMAVIAGARFGHHEEGYRLGKMACYSDGIRNER